MDFIRVSSTFFSPQCLLCPDGRREPLGSCNEISGIPSTGRLCVWGTVGPCPWCLANFFLSLPMAGMFRRSFMTSQLPVARDAGNDEGLAAYRSQQRRPPVSGFSHARDRKPEGLFFVRGYKKTTVRYVTLCNYAHSLTEYSTYGTYVQHIK